jgi:hypothetical protein
MLLDNSLIELHYCLLQSINSLEELGQIQVFSGNCLNEGKRHFLLKILTLMFPYQSLMRFIFQKKVPSKRPYVLPKIKPAKSKKKPSPANNQTPLITD